MLQLSNVSKTFKNLHVLKSFSATVNPGDFVIIMGPNGTGKTTLFDMISGKVPPDSGSICLDGIDITAMSEQKRAGFISRLFQNTYLGSCSALTVRENLAMATLKERAAGFQRATAAFPENIVAEFLAPLNLEKFLDVPMSSLSGGQRQMIAFIMSILKPPKLLLLDEPTAALDPTSATQLLSFAKKYSQTHKVPILLITHDPMIAKHLGDRLWVLGNGTIQKEFGAEKSTMSPQDFFHPIHYEAL
ncbi:MAG: ATP-binding cassette domain-containing protein [Chlamydiales bacterium]|nr:ATP-binding cassette domain-containing protein [Chlamydiales bacterium]